MIVKVCGVRTPEIADVAIAAGADWLGLVLVPGSPRHADHQAACAIVANVRGRADLVGVMVSPTAQECSDAAARYRLSAVQVHGDIRPSLAVESPVPIIRALNLRHPANALVDEWWPDLLLLLDAAPDSEADLPGGTGKRVDEEAAAALARHRHVILAGGLDAGNVTGAIERVRPDGVDASSGLESAPGVKDAARVEAYVHAARVAFDAAAARRVP